MHSPAYEVVLDRQSPLFDDCASLRFGIHLDPTVPMRAAGSGGWDRTQDLRVNLRSVGAGDPESRCPLGDGVGYASWAIAGPPRGGLGAYRLRLEQRDRAFRHADSIPERD